jgi:hypothetical protein
MRWLLIFDMTIGRYMAGTTIVIVILNIHICFGVFIVKQDNVIFSYNITNISACRTDTDSFQGMLGIKLQDCVKECGLRKHCKALSYGRKLRICKLFLTKNEEYLFNGDCVYVTDDDIKVEKVVYVHIYKQHCALL